MLHCYSTQSSCRIECWGDACNNVTIFCDGIEVIPNSNVTYTCPIKMYCRYAEKSKYCQDAFQDYMYYYSYDTYNCDFDELVQSINEYGLSNIINTDPFAHEENLEEDVLSVVKPNLIELDGKNMTQVDLSNSYNVCTNKTLILNSTCTVANIFNTNYNYTSNIISNYSYDYYNGSVICATGYSALGHYDSFLGSFWIDDQTQMDQLNSILTLYSDPNIVRSDNYVINKILTDDRWFMNIKIWQNKFQK